MSSRSQAVSSPSSASEPPANFDRIWTAVERTATACGLDPSLYGGEQRAVVAQILSFLATSPIEKAPEDGGGNGRSWRSLLRRSTPTHPPEPAPVPPVIISGPPGTGKTSFLSVVDLVLRQQLDHLDTLPTSFTKADGSQFQIEPRRLVERPLILLSVRKWAQLLHFFAWDRQAHRLDAAAQTTFIQQTLRPLRVIFADEVEMVGYSPTLPDLAQQGILVVGSSNQHRFSQLVSENLPPEIVRFDGEDLRAGDPEEVVVRPEEGAWAIFERVGERPLHTFERLPYQLGTHADQAYLRLDFKRAVNAPLLETEWSRFLHQVFQEGCALNAQCSGLTLLLDSFSLDYLLQRHSAVMRFVSLLDAVEQLRLGLLVRHPTERLSLKREVFEEMQTVILNAPGVVEDVKQRTVVGIDRATSRLAQAGYTARREFRVVSSEC